MHGIEGEKKDEIINRQLCQFFQADENLGKAIAAVLGIDLNLNIEKQQQKNYKL